MSQSQNLDTVINSNISEFFESNGNPTELDDEISARYFKILEESVGQKSILSFTKSALDFTSDSAAPTPFVSLSAEDKIIFVAQQIESDIQIPGYSKVIGIFELGAPFKFKLTNVTFGFARLSIFPDDGSLDRIEFISSQRYKVPEVEGSGTIVDFESLRAAK
ncbi:hypothetical protein RSOLAG22IIIB_09434 [Rhizoctonia solani]|uniref:Uncharacterized protein n=1 Tax=Rhizoctonia solani TaxID=456999 RepID=A0A0K6FYN5_9AGAM|nr:hypothetical protein RSOLAG22IIIB_09434 [Rhizoctonia solani]